jgi:hypothetical protein
MLFTLDNGIVLDHHLILLPLKGDHHWSCASSSIRPCKSAGVNGCLPSSFAAIFKISLPVVNHVVLDSNPFQWNFCFRRQQSTLFRQWHTKLCGPVSLHKLKTMMFDLVWAYKDISPDFVADFLVQGNNPKPTAQNDKLRLVPKLFPTFVVMSCVVKERCFKGSDLNTGVASCYDLVLMDGSKTCFAARLNSGLTKKLHGYTVLPGASFTVKDYDIILLTHDSNEPILNRMVMFVKVFSWQTAPSYNTFGYPEIDSSDEWTTDTFQKVFLTSMWYKM